MLYIRGQRADYDGWRQLGCEGWAWDDVLPYFRRCQNQERGACDIHGVGGPLNVSDPTTGHEVSEAVIEACEALGLPHRDPNGAEQEGVGWYQVTIKDGKRCSAAVAYLHPAMERPNLQVETRALASRILFEGKRAVGVEFVQNGVTRVARAERRGDPRRRRGQLAAAAPALRESARPPCCASTASRSSPISRASARISRTISSPARPSGSRRASSRSTSSSGARASSGRRSNICSAGRACSPSPPPMSRSSASRARASPSPTSSSTSSPRRWTRTSSPTPRRWSSRRSPASPSRPASCARNRAARSGSSRPIPPPIRRSSPIISPTGSTRK